MLNNMYCVANSGHSVCGSLPDQIGAWSTSCATTYLRCFEHQKSEGQGDSEYLLGLGVVYHADYMSGPR